MHRLKLYNKSSTELTNDPYTGKYMLIIVILRRKDSILHHFF